MADKKDFARIAPCVVTCAMAAAVRAQRARWHALLGAAHTSESDGAYLRRLVRLGLPGYQAWHEAQREGRAFDASALQAFGAMRGRGRSRRKTHGPPETEVLAGFDVPRPFFEAIDAARVLGFSRSSRSAVLRGVLAFGLLAHAVELNAADAAAHTIEGGAT